MQKKVGFGASRRIHHILGYSINSPGIDGTRDVAYFGLGCRRSSFRALWWRLIRVDSIRMCSIEHWYIVLRTTSQVEASMLIFRGPKRKPLNNNNPNTCGRLTCGSPNNSGTSQFQRSQVGTDAAAAKIAAMTKIQNPTTMNFIFSLTF